MSMCDASTLLDADDGRSGPSDRWSCPKSEDSDARGSEREVDRLTDRVGLGEDTGGAGAGGITVM